jgi:hypothetical protein
MNNIATVAADVRRRTEQSSADDSSHEGKNDNVNYNPLETLPTVLPK